MQAEKINIPDDLLQLKPFDALESVSMSQLARNGTALLRQLMDKAQAVAVKVEGQDAMVTVSQRQYDEMVTLIDQIRQIQYSQSGDGDGFTMALGEQFDQLVAQMNRPDAARATHAALFAEPAALNDTYRLGTTEMKD